LRTNATPPKFWSNLLDWPINRRDRTFHVYVVEPGQYEPKAHSQIFNAAINLFIEAEPALLDPFAKAPAFAVAPRFDLLTFPEAFLPPPELLGILRYIGNLTSFGCVHVGLRPSSSEANHLFQANLLRGLVAELKTVPGVVVDDLEPFSEWLSHQHDDFRFNVGCVFTLDGNRRIRVCLHPKMVRSKAEVSPLPETHMQEANLLTVITLRPVDKTLQTVTIQPLLCSDALHLDTDRRQSRPLEAITADAEWLGDNPPDHIDIVSVATCTPQVEVRSLKDESYRMWHQEFRSTFVRAASDDALSRHHFSTFVLSNFRMLSATEPGGLSGAFIPVPVGGSEFPGFVALSCWGRPKGWKGDNRWSTPDDGRVDKKAWCSRGYLASLNPFTEKAGSTARVFGFEIHRLPRDMSLWRNNSGLTQCTVRFAENRGEPPSLVFAR
jgi:hypothetical protein